MKNYIKNITKNIIIFFIHPSRTSYIKVSRLILFFLFAIPFFSGCNLCPNSPSDGGNGTSENIYSTLIPLNSSIPMITRISPNNYGFKQLNENGFLFSPPANNGNYVFLRVDSTDNKKIMMLGNINNSSISLLEKESKDFSIFQPIISPNGNQIVFLGGSNQIFLWVNNPETSASYIDKISNKAIDNSIPTFSLDNSKLAFLEETDNSISLKIVNPKSPDATVFSYNFDDEILNFGLDSYLSFSRDAKKILFLAQKDSFDIFNLIDIEKNSLKEIKVKRTDFGVRIAKLSPDGNFAAFSVNDGNIWTVNLKEETPLFSRLTNVDPCNSFLYLDWSSDGKKLIAQSYNCNDISSTGSSLYLINIEESNNLLVPINSILFCNNIQRAFWGN